MYGYIMAIRSHHRSPITTLLLIFFVAIATQACDEQPPNEPPHASVSDSAVISTLPNLDSTSHKYSWQTWLFGDMPTGVWYDVSAINEHNAIVVGHVDLRDSAMAQHAVRWDGETWKYFTVYLQHRGLLYVDPDSIVLYADNTIHQVWGEAPNNWTFSMGYPIYFDGTSFVTEHYFHRHPDSASAWLIWGNEKDRWYYGPHGKITHASGRNFSLQPTLTNRFIYSMAANKHEAWAVSYDGRPGTVLRYSNGTWRNWSDHLAIHLNSTHAVWCDEIGMRPGGTVVLVGINIVQYDTTWKNVTRPMVNFMPGQRFFRCVHGSGRNNIWAAGYWGSVAHFNGNTWIHYPELQGGPELCFYSVWALENHVFLVGQKGAQAIIVMGTRVD